MPDSSKPLPLAPNLSEDMLQCIKHWHNQQVVHLDHNKGPNRDHNTITRSELMIQRCNEELRRG